MRQRRLLTRAALSHFSAWWFPARETAIKAN